MSTLNPLWKHSLGLVCVLFGMFSPMLSERKAEAHFPFGHWNSFHRHHYGYYQSSYGFGGRNWGYYPSSQLYINSYARSYPFGFCPSPFCNVARARYFSVGYYPTFPVAAPAYHYSAPVYYAPTYYAPSYQDPCWNTYSYGYSMGSTPSNYDSFTARTVKRGPRDYFMSEPMMASARTPSQADRDDLTTKPMHLASVNLQDKLDQPLMLRVRNDDASSASKPLQPVAQQDGKVQKVGKLRILQPYSPIWTKAAAGLVDDMIKEGHFLDAAASCKSMEKIEQPKGAGVYLRQGLMRFFSEEGHTKTSMEVVLGLLDEACQSGSELSPSELYTESLQAYFSACSVDVARSLESLSKQVLESPSKSDRELLLLSVLLKLDGQTSKAKLFASEVRNQVNSNVSFRWDSLLQRCLN